MPITIGGKEFATTKPKDLDERLLNRKGVSAAEAKAMLKGSPTADFVAAALAPFLADDAPSAAELAMLIAADGSANVAPLVAALYGDDEPAVEHEAEA